MKTPSLATRTCLAIVAISLLATAASARVISYSPYSDRVSFPAQQHRMNRHFVLVESAGTSLSGGGPMPIVGPYGYPNGQLVVYDSKGLEEPRVILPNDGQATAAFTSVAVKEDGGNLRILVQTSANINGANPTGQMFWFLTNDGGTTWKLVTLPVTTIMNIGTWTPDNGGPIVHNRWSPIRIGTPDFPFVVALNYLGTNIQGVYSIAKDGTPTKIFGSGSAVSLVGSDVNGSRFLVRSPSDTLSMVDLAGTVTPVAKINANGTAEGWITPENAVYLEQRDNNVTITRYAGGATTFTKTAAITDGVGMFMVPTYAYGGAWVLERGAGQPTVLSFHDFRGLVPQWSDITAPQVEALHTGSDGFTLLVQVHRPRPQADQRLFKDPALAFWRVTQSEPRAYDELFMNEQDTKGFVHLDVMAAQQGDPFVFDSGFLAAPGTVISPGVPPPVSGGGSDVIQEWGVVRASFAQHLVLPGIGRTPGAYGSYWMSDVIIQNPLSDPQDVDIRFVPNGEVTAQVINKVTLTLLPHEIRVIPDALKTLFSIENGGGVFFIDPTSGVSATSRTYTKDSKGTYGFGMNAIDIYGGSASPRFPVTFSGAFVGTNFRTNLIMTDVSGRGTKVSAFALGLSGSVTGTANFSAPTGGQQQFNGVSTALGLSPADFGALVIQPTTGQAIASVFTIDNRTNDPTYFPPDLPSPVVRTIPAIGHVDGANNSKFRSDLYIINPSNQTRTLTLQMKMWDSADTQTINFTMLPNEARVIPDVLFRLFGKTGFARLRYQSFSDANGIRVTSRTYSIDDNGGTYGFLMPPLNNFQAASSGDTLEILGVVGGTGFRTNIGLVELSSFAAAQPASAKVEIIDDKGATVDSFTVTVPSAGGMQLNDIFTARGLGSGPAAALIRISPISGMIGAYATMNDNGTNDPTYLAANLAARQ